MYNARACTCQWWAIGASMQRRERQPKTARGVLGGRVVSVAGGTHVFAAWTRAASVHVAIAATSARRDILLRRRRLGAGHTWPSEWGVCGPVATAPPQHTNTSRCKQAVLAARVEASALWMDGARAVCAGLASAKRAPRKVTRLIFSDHNGWHRKCQGYYPQ